eukprot:scaffold6021_cov117-Isochrysis_galbana.AAC.8
MRSTECTAVLPLPPGVSPSVLPARRIRARHRVTAHAHAPHAIRRPCPRNQRDCVAHQRELPGHRVLRGAAAAVAVGPAAAVAAGARGSLFGGARGGQRPPARVRGGALARRPARGRGGALRVLRLLEGAQRRVGHEPLLAAGAEQGARHGALDARPGARGARPQGPGTHHQKHLGGVGPPLPHRPQVDGAQAGGPLDGRRVWAGLLPHGGHGRSLQAARHAGGADGGAGRDPAGHPARLGGHAHAGGQRHLRPARGVAVRGAGVRAAGAARAVRRRQEPRHDHLGPRPGQGAGRLRLGPQPVARRRARLPL